MLIIDIFYNVEGKKEFCSIDYSGRKTNVSKNYETKDEHYFLYGQLIFQF